MTLQPSHPPCATHLGGPSFAARHSLSVRLDALIHPDECRPVPSQARLKRRPMATCCYRSVRAPDCIKRESDDESNYLLTPVAQSRGVKRRLQPIEDPHRKRVRLSSPTTHHGATPAPTNGPGVLLDLEHFRSEVRVQQHDTHPSIKQPHFMLWVAHMVLLYVVRVQTEDWPRPAIPHTVVYDFANDVQAVMSEYQLPDFHGIREVLILHCLWYLQKLSPKGFIDIEDLLTEAGLLAARRLLLLACNFTSTWLVDYSTLRIARFLPYYGKGFSPSALRTLEISGLEAFDYSLDISSTQLDGFRSSLAEWSSRIDILSPFYDAHRWMAKNLRELTLDTRPKSMQERKSRRPSSFSIFKVHAGLLTGLDDLLKKFPSNCLDSPAPPIACQSLPKPHIPSRRFPASPWPDDFYSDLKNEDLGPYLRRQSRPHHVRPRPYPSVRQ